MRAHGRQLLIIAWVALVAARATAGPLDRLATDDPRALAAAVADIERAQPGDPDVVFAAARACEDRLLDPARALALYERIGRAWPDARVARAAAQRAGRLRAELGAAGEYEPEATARAHLVVDAERLPPDEVVHRGDALAHAAWPGARGVARWLGDWLCRHGRYADAQARYALFRDAEATRAAAECALDTHHWARAAELASRLPGGDDHDRDVRDALLAAAAKGRARARRTEAAWVALAIALAVLAASFLEAALRKPRAALGRVLRPPVEIAYLAPIAALLVAIAFTAQRLIAPAVLRIVLVGLAGTWLSGATLDRLRATSRPVRARAVVHVLACAVAVLVTGYLVLVRDGLLDMLAASFH